MKRRLVYAVATVVSLLVVLPVLDLNALFVPSESTPPAGHQAVVNRVRVTTIFHDTQGQLYDYVMTPQPVFVGWEPELPPPNFGANLPESDWIYRYGQVELRGFNNQARFYDVGMIMKVWGPFPSGSYVVEFGRLNGGLMKIYIDGQLKCTFDWATEQPALGYYSVAIEGR